MTECFVLVGSRPERAYIFQTASSVLAKLGIVLVIVSDTPIESKPPNTYSVTTELTLNLQNFPAIATEIQHLLQQNQLTVCGVYTALDKWVECAAWLTDHFQNTRSRLAQIQATLAKFQMRKLLSKHPGLAVEFSALSSSDQAADWLKSHPGRWVIKPSRGAGSRGVTTDIKEPGQARLAWHHCQKDVRPSSDDDRQSYVRVIIEEELTGAEVDVELVVQRGEVMFACVADNPEIRLPQVIESSSTYPSRLSHADQQNCIDVAVQALGILGLDTGNFHVEMVCTDQGPRIIEVNPRMGGAFVWHAIRAVYDVDLIELGVLATLEKLTTCVSTQVKEVIEAKFLIANQSGILRGVRGIDKQQTQNNVRHIQLWKAIGDDVRSPDPSDYVGFVLCAGQGHDQALKNAERTLNNITLNIEPHSVTKSDSGHSQQTPDLSQ